MEFVLGSLACFALTFGGHLVRDRLVRFVRGRRRLRISCGEPVSFPVSLRVDDGSPRRGRLFRRDDQMYVRTWRRGFCFPTSAHRPVTEPGWVPKRELEVERIRLLDDGRRVVELGVVVEDLSLVTAVMGGADRPGPRIAFAPALAALAFGLIALAPGIFSLVSYDARAEVMGTDVPNASCQVRWEHAGQVYFTGVDCTDGDVAAPIGSMIPILAQRWPFEGQAVAGTRSDALPFMALLAVPAAISLGLGRWRAGSPRKPVPLSPVPAAGILPGPDDPAVPQRATAPLVDVVRSYQAAQRLPGVDSPGVSRRTLVGDTRRAARATPMWWIWAGGVLSWVLDRWLLSHDVPEWWAVLPLTVGVLVVVQRFLQALARLHALWTEPATSTWQGLAITDPDGAWVLLLGQGSRIQWAATIESRLPLSDTWALHGVPGEGLVRLVSSDGTSRFAVVQRVDDEKEREIREDLLSRLRELSRTG